MKAAEYTVEYNKVFINLASLLLGTSLIFVAQITTRNETSLTLLVASWLFWVVSIYLGARAIGDISDLVSDAEVDEKDEKTPTFPALYIADRLASTKITTKIRGQLWTFILGFACLIANAALIIV